MKFFKENLDEVSPKGWEKTVKAMKKHKDIDNPYALANYMKAKGYKSRKESVEQVDESMTFEFGTSEQASKFADQAVRQNLASATDQFKSNQGDHMVELSGPHQAGAGSPTMAHKKLAKLMKKNGGRFHSTNEGPRIKRVFKESSEQVDELKIPAKDERGRSRDPEIRKAYKRGQARADNRADAKLRKGDADGAENPMTLARKRKIAAKTPMDEVNVGDTIHLGHATKGGTGVVGKVHMITGDKVHIKNDKGQLHKGLKKNATVKETADLEERMVQQSDGNYVHKTDGDSIKYVTRDKSKAKRFSKSQAKRIAKSDEPGRRVVREEEAQLDEMQPHGMFGGYDPKEKETPSYQAYLKRVKGEQQARRDKLEKERQAKKNESVELDEMSAKAHYKKYQSKFRVPPIDRNRYPDKEKQGLEGPYRSKKSGKIFYYDKKAGKYYDTDSDMYLSVNDVMEEQTPLQRRAETERGEANAAEKAARSDVKRRRARTARREYAKERNRKLDLGEASSKEIKDLVTRYNKIKGKSAKVSGKDVILNGKKIKADVALETMAVAVMKLESISPVVSFLDYQKLDEKKTTKIQDVGPTSPHWKKCKLTSGIKYGNKVLKKGDTVFCHPFDNDRVVIRPTMKDGNAFLRRSSIENPPAPLKETMGTRPEVESPSGRMARAYKQSKGTPAERYATAKDKVKNIRTQNTSGQSVKTFRDTEASREITKRASDRYKGGNF